MEYIESRQQLRYGGRMSEEAYQHFIAKSDDVEYREALTKLKLESNQRFVTTPPPTNYTTTRPGRYSVELDSLPSGFVIPARFVTQIAFVKGTPGSADKPAEPNRLASWHPLSTETRDAIVSEIEHFAAQHPGTDVTALTAAVHALHERGRQLLTLASYPIPESLQSKMTLVNGGRAIQLTGPLMRNDEVDEASALLKGVSDPDIRATLSSLRDGSAFAPPNPNFTDLVEWLLWPGVTLMVVSSLVAFSFSWRSLWRSFTGSRTDTGAPREDTGEVTKNWFIFG